MNTEKRQKSGTKVRGISYKNDAFRKAKWCYERVINGKRVRTFFTTKEAAVRAKALALSEAAKGADVRRLFDAAAQKEYDAAKQILAGKISLVDCALWFREHEAEWSERNATVDDAAKAVYAALNERGVSDSYHRNATRYVRAFAKTFGTRSLSSMRGKEIAEWILSVGGKNLNTIRTVKSRIVYMFSLAVSLELVQSAPRIPAEMFPRREQTPVAVYTSDDAQKLLRSLLASQSALLPTFALLLFCGLRRTEANAMRWEWIDEKRKRIVIPAKICKTRDDWVLQSPALPPTVWKWLAAVPADEKSGKFPTLENRKLFRILADAGVEYRRNGFRHTFCTMHISLADSAEKTALLLRHRGTQMLYRHYLAKLVPKEEAERYFALAPATV